MDEVREFIESENKHAATPLVWTPSPVGRTLDAWREEAGDFVCHSGTLLHVRSAHVEGGGGVWMAGIIGFFYLGQKRTDGSVAMHASGAVDWSDAAVIVEYHDPPFEHGCHRSPSGAVVCLCPDDF